MRICPSCGYGNTEDADHCQMCGRGLMAAALPAEASPAAPDLPTGQTEAPKTAATSPIEAPQAVEAAPIPPGEAPPPPIAAESSPPSAVPPFAAAPPPMQWAAAPGGPPPPMIPPGQPPMSRHQHRSQFLLGILTGLIPLGLLLITYSVSLTNSTSSASLGLLIYGAIGAVITYVAAIIAMIVCLSMARVRFIGYGLLAAVASSPVIAPIACNVISTLTVSFR